MLISKLTQLYLTAEKQVLLSYEHISIESESQGTQTSIKTKTDWEAVMEQSTPRGHDHLMQRSTPDSILEQKEDISDNIAEIQMKPGI